MYGAIIAVAIFVCLGVIVRVILEKTSGVAEASDNKDQQMALGVQMSQGRDKLFPQ
ncbi:MAG: hypothetical protein IKQ71_08600 [Lachnospiraceae bacterium]|nr:hypothetical protein [Lachnospiraceae bacterium]